MPNKDPNFVSAINILNKQSINYWICNGTALGIYRNKKLIPWDNDIDIGIWKNNANTLKLKQIFKKEGFKVKKKFFDKDSLISFTRPGGRDLDFNIHEYCEKKKMCISKYYVHKNIVMRLIFVLSLSGNYHGNYKTFINLFYPVKKLFEKLKIFLIKNNFFYQVGGYTIPTIYFKNFKILYLEGLKIRAPFYLNKYLVYLYGKNWKKPLKNYNWEKNSNFASNK